MAPTILHLLHDSYKCKSCFDVVVVLSVCFCCVFIGFVFVFDLQ